MNEKVTEKVVVMHRNIQNTALPGLAEEVLSSPLRFQGRGKVTFTDIISSPIAFFYYKTTLPHSSWEISILLRIFPSSFPHLQGKAHTRPPVLHQHFSRTAFTHLCIC